jgi:hypothetical protein
VFWPPCSRISRRVVYRRFHCYGGRVRVGLTSDPNLIIIPKAVTVRIEPRTLHPRVPPRRPVETAVPLTMPLGTLPPPFGLQFTFS